MSLMTSSCCSSSCCGKSDQEARTIPRVDSVITRKDTMQRRAFRLGIGRKRLTVTPGLYALGSPGTADPVLVSANFKVTFDQLRADMHGRDAWLLILDTKGINVWCAAGKGTFGTEELIRRIEDSGLASLVSHRYLILPQLGAPGIKAHEVGNRTGFRILYGPVSSRDLPDYLDAGMKASSLMRRKTFTLAERMIQIPLELVQSWKVLLAVTVLSFILTVLLGGIDAVTVLYDAVPSFLAILAGACITPFLLPYIPGRAFSIKGAIAGGLLAGLFIVLFTPPFSQGFFITCIVIAASSFLAMNFTGATPFTSLSGVRKEMHYALPVQIGLIGIAIAGRVLLETVFKGGIGA